MALVMKTLILLKINKHISIQDGSVHQKRRKPKVKLVTLLLCEVKEIRSSFYEKVPSLCPSLKSAKACACPWTRQQVTEPEPALRSQAVLRRVARAQAREGERDIAMFAEAS